ncbi:HNH endonuclease [Xanthomonas phage DES1]|nr:HNH endonuclease [Xanthomonas phage DES1]
MARKTEPFRHYPEWSEARFWSFVRSALRAAWSRYPVKYKVLAKAKRAYKGPNKNQKYEFQCAQCGGWFKAKEVSVDHIIPAGTLKCYADLPSFVEKLFVSEEELQVLCTADHQVKSNAERAARKEIK